MIPHTDAVSATENCDSKSVMFVKSPVRQRQCVAIVGGQVSLCVFLHFVYCAFDFYDISCFSLDIRKQNQFNGYYLVSRVSHTKMDEISWRGY